MKCSTSGQLSGENKIALTEKSTWIFIFQKYGEFVPFIKHKILISEV